MKKSMQHEKSMNDNDDGECTVHLYHMMVVDDGPSDEDEWLSTIRNSQVDVAMFIVIHEEQQDNSLAMTMAIAVIGVQT